jgi:hypothetical protein
MTPDLQRVLGRYVDSGWVDANRGVDERPVALRGFVIPAYLVLASDILVQPRSEVQVTARCYQPFRAHKMIVAEDSARFDLVDLKVGVRSQFTRAQSIPLREHVALVSGVRHEVRPDPIRWPLDTCACGSEVSARAIIADGCEEDHGANFEIVLLGETVL